MIFHIVIYIAIVVFMKIGVGEKEGWGIKKKTYSYSIAIVV